MERVPGTPEVQIFTDAGGTRIGLRTPAAQADPLPSSLVEIETRKRSIGGTEFVEISTTNSALYRDFYAFACAIADRLQIDGIPVAAAVDSALEAWAALLQRLSLLHDERQIGLMGELWLLRRIADVSGWQTAIEAWQGPNAEEHDFALARADVEVKSTLSEKRLHVIGSLTQLTPTGSTPLFILSLQLTGAGASSGESLTEAVEAVQEQVTLESGALQQRLRERLDAAGWKPQHALHYRRRFVMRTPAALVPVDDRCPVITPTLLAGLGPDRLARLGQVVYRVDLTGLGYEDGTSEFHTVLPAGGAS